MKNYVPVVSALFSVMLIFSISTSTLAVEKKEYESNGEIGFYGEYIYPDDENPSDDDDENNGSESGNGSSKPGNNGSESGDGSSKPGNNGSELGNGSSKPGNNGSESGNVTDLNSSGSSNKPNLSGNSTGSLPQTGLNHSYLIGIIGLIAVLTGLLLLIYKKNKRKGFE